MKRNAAIHPFKFDNRLAVVAKAQGSACTNMSSHVSSTLLKAHLLPIYIYNKIMQISLKLSCIGGHILYVDNMQLFL